MLEPIVRSNYVLLLADNGLRMYWKNTQTSVWEAYLVHGEECNAVNSAGDLTNLVDEFENNINLSDGLRNCAITMLYGQEDIALLDNISSTLCALQCTDWQVLNWTTITQRVGFLGLKTGSDFDQKQMIKIGLPLLERLLAWHEQDEVFEISDALSMDQENQEDFAQQKILLEKELAKLQQQVKMARGYDIESLLVYLPIIYRNVWTHIKPSDLALIAGTYQVPDVPSPFPEPDHNTIAIMKRRLQALPRTDLAKLQNFCQDVTHLLKHMRPEMQFLLEE